MRKGAIRRGNRLGLRLGLPLILLPLMLSVPLRAGEATIPAGRLADLSLKIMTYDQKLTQKVKDTIRIGIVFPGDRAADARQLLEAFEGRKDFKVSGFPFEAALLPYESIPSGEGWTAWVVFPGGGAYLAGVSREARRGGVLTIGVCRDCVDPLSLGLVPGEGKIGIHRCDECLKAENIQLSAPFLGITITGR